MLDYVVVDVETNGLDYGRHQAVEVAWWNLATGRRGEFVPKHDVSEVLATASIEALRINRYVDRLADAPQDDGTAAAELRDQFSGQDGSVLVGSNPRFDTHMLLKLPEFAHGEPWHYRLLDVGAYGAGVLRRPRSSGIPGLWELSQALGIAYPAQLAHTAAGDVTVTGQVLRELWNRAGADA